MPPNQSPPPPRRRPHLGAPPRVGGGAGVKREEMGERFAVLGLTPQALLCRPAGAFGTVSKRLGADRGTEPPPPGWIMEEPAPSGDLRSDRGTEPPPPG